MINLPCIKQMLMKDIMNEIRYRQLCVENICNDVFPWLIKQLLLWFRDIGVPRYWSFECNLPGTGGLPSQGPSISRRWYFLCCSPEQVIEHTVQLSVTWDAMALMWRHFNVYLFASSNILVAKCWCYSSLLLSGQSSIYAVGIHQQCSCKCSNTDTK